MGSDEPARSDPDSHEEAALILAKCAAEGTSVRVAGAGTKHGWGGGRRADLVVGTGGLDSIVEHNVGDLTAVVEAGVPLARAQETFASAGQMFALDPPLGAGDAATIGGVLASADSGPLRHRHGSGRDLVLGCKVALSDGTIARSGGKVIKNVAGYDLAKLFTGSFGSLGMILEVAIRLHPLPSRRATAVGICPTPESLAAGASVLAHAQAEIECLDFAWSGGEGRLLARFSGLTAHSQAEAAVATLATAGVQASASVDDDDDDELWRAQRRGQRSAEGVVVRVAGLQTDLQRLATFADSARAGAVGRAGLGVSWLRFDAADPEAAVAAVAELRAHLGPRRCVVLDAPEGVRGALDVWDESDGGVLGLTMALKQRFDPPRIMSPGALPGGI